MDDWQKMRIKKPQHYDPSNYYIISVKGTETELSTGQATHQFGELGVAAMDKGEVLSLLGLKVERANGKK